MSKVCSAMLTRRSLLGRLLGMGLALPFAGVLEASNRPQEPHKTPAQPPKPTSLSPEDDQFLEQLEEANFCYFWEQADPDTGLVKDRCLVHGNDNGIAGSIAATG